jgi:cytidylate kinase
MYRAVTWALLQRGTDLGDPAAIARDAVDLRLESGTDPQSPTIAVDGADVSEAVRDDDVNAHVSPVAAVPEVRSMLVDQQRAIIAEATGGIVVEGRDIGSTVAPDAPVKVFLVADAQARAARRAAERGGADEAATAASLAARDAIDSTRATSPLTRADGAVQIDGTHLTLDEVVDAVVQLVEEARTT